MRLVCRLTGKLSDGTVFADHQADDNLLEVIIGEGELRCISRALQECTAVFQSIVLADLL